LSENFDFERAKTFSCNSDILTMTLNVQRPFLVIPIY
jgi:hypothetical protein